MQSLKVILSISRGIELTSRVAVAGAGGILAVMMFFTALDVALRYFFNKPIMGSFELTEYMMSVAISLGLAYCAMVKGHVNVDFVISRFPQRARSITMGIINFVTSGVFFLLTWQCVEQTKISKFSGITSPILFIPTYPFIAILAFGCALTGFIFLINFLEILIWRVQK